MKIGVSSYSFYEYLKEGKMTPFDVLEKAKDLEFDGVEFVDFTIDAEKDRLELAKILRQKADELGIEICGYSFGADLIKETDEECREEIERVKQEINVAKALGVDLIRHDTMFTLKRFRSFDLCLPLLGEECREISEYAALNGIRTTVENHGSICQGSDRVERLFNAVNCSNFGLLVDIGNFLCTDENPAHAVAVTAPYAFRVHIKDFKIHSCSEAFEGGFLTREGNCLEAKAIGEGDVPVKQCIEILKNAGYDDYLVIEYEGKDDCIEGIKRGAKYVREIIE